MKNQRNLNVSEELTKGFDAQGDDSRYKTSKQNAKKIISEIESLRHSLDVTASRKRENLTGMKKKDFQDLRISFDDVITWKRSGLRK